MERERERRTRGARSRELATADSTNFIDSHLTKSVGSGGVGWRSSARPSYTTTLEESHSNSTIRRGERTTERSNETLERSERWQRRHSVPLPAPAPTSSRLCKLSSAPRRTHISPRAESDWISCFFFERSRQLRILIALSLRLSRRPSTRRRATRARSLSPRASPLVARASLRPAYPSERAPRRVRRRHACVMRTRNKACASVRE